MLRYLNATTASSPVASRHLRNPVPIPQRRGLVLRFVSSRSGNKQGSLPRSGTTPDTIAWGTSYPSLGTRLPSSVYPSCRPDLTAPTRNVRPRACGVYPRLRSSIFLFPSDMRCTPPTNEVGAAPGNLRCESRRFVRVSTLSRWI